MQCATGCFLKGMALFLVYFAALSDLHALRTHLQKSPLPGMSHTSPWPASSKVLVKNTGGADVVDVAWHHDNGLPVQVHGIMIMLADVAAVACSGA